MRASPAEQSFVRVAPFYDDLMDGVPYRMWVSYYLLLLAQMELRPRRVLDVCCGTGTVCELLHDEGFVVAGFDKSLAMVERAREKAIHALKDIRYECQDATDFDMGELYEGAFSFFDSLNYIADPSDLQLALKRVAAHIEPGGSFVFDMNTAYAFEAKMFDQRNLRSSAKVRYDWKSDWDSATRIIQVHMKFWTAEGETEETHVQRAYSIEEMREMLDEAGFGQVQVYDSYALNPPRGKSDRIHYTAVRED